jgi:RHS repeat-associated protein
VQNLTGQGLGVPNPPAYNPTYPDQNVRTETIYDVRGDAIATVDNAGRITRTYYDAQHRARYVTQNLVGQGVEVSTPPTYNPTYPDRNVTGQSVYDGLGNAVRTIDPLGKVSHSCYDGQGRVTKAIENPSVADPCGSYSPSPDTDRDIITLTTYDAAGNRKTSSDPNGKTTNYAYDNVYRLSSETDPLVHATSYGYDVVGNRISMTDARSVVTRYEYDALGRLKAVVENYKSGQPVTVEQNVRTEYTYDGTGNRKSIKDARLNSTTFLYDALGRLTSETDPLSRTWTYGYDGLGSRVSLLDANGATTTYSHDALGRQTGIDYPTPDSDVSFTYDAAGNRHTMVDGVGTTTWTYDALNRPTAILDPYSATVAYGYNAGGLRTSITYPDSKQVGYTYDLTGRLHVVTDWDTLVTTYTFDRGSRPATTTLPNGLVSTYAFDDANRLTALSQAIGTTTYASYGYVYDNVGNRTSMSETVLQPDTTPTDILFMDGFETGNLSAWSAAKTDGGDLAASTASAIAGTYGVQATLDDNTSVFLSDWTPVAESQYRARFYFDPNTISMASGDAHYIFQALNPSSVVVARLEFRSYQGDYQVRAEAVNDSTGWSSTSWVTLRDQMHYLEIQWKAATAAGANNGILTLWTDGTQRATFTNIDNDTRRVDSAQLGAVSGVDTGTRGTYFLDAFESRKTTYIGPDPAAPTPPAPPTPPDGVFTDSFETGTLGAWSASVTDGGNLSATTQAAIAGSYGLQAVINDNNSIYVADWTPFDDVKYRARFHFDPNSIAMNGGDAHYLFYASNAGGTVIIRVELRYNYGDYQVRAEALNDTGGWNSSPWVAITDGPHAFEFNWQAATAAGANNGVFTFWIDGTQSATWTNIDNDTRRIDLAQVGAVAGIDTTTRGTEYFDAFASRRNTYIGPDPTAPAPPGWPAKGDPLFSDGFETGNFSNWTWASTDGTSLSVTTGAAVCGTYGMNANINDNNAIYVNDWRPFEENKYRARFHFDPNSIAMNGGDAHYLFYAGNRDSTVIVRIELRYNYGDYQVRAEALNDTGGWNSSPWVAITDGPHALEFNWQAATAVGANNGVFTFWIDGTQSATWTNIDNDTRRIEYVQLGPVAGIDTPTRGTEFFDCFESRRNTYIGPDPTAPAPPGWPAKGDPLFSDGFETGNFSNWTWASTDGTSLSVTTAAALAGTYGMSANINDNNLIYVNDWKPFEENTYRARFYFDPNSITMTTGDRHYIFRAGNRDAVILARVELYRASGIYQVRAEVSNDANAWSTGGWRTISDAPHYLEIYWRAATAPGANNGGLTFWIDGVQQDNFATVDNDTRRVEFVQLGPVEGIDNGTRGTLYFDAFESRRNTYIGPVAGLLSGYRMVDLPSWDEIRSWVASVLVPEAPAMAAVSAPAPQAVDSAIVATPAAPLPATPAPHGGVAHVLAAPVRAPVAEAEAAPLAGSVSRSITYTYDNLYRLTGASYNDGTSFTYAYDATGNRLTEVTTGGLSIAYVYDNANRLTSVDGMPLTWDNNGNLLSDGSSTNTYDKANRLKTVVQGSTAYAFTYSGLGDRLRQTVGGTPTTYVLDLDAGLTQVLADGTNFYLYGIDRIGEKQAGGWRYHVPDGLGSVRQLVDASGVVSLARGYRPFGDPLTTVGSGATTYGFAGEQRDATGLVFLRARFYAPAQGRFLTRDVWEGDPQSPMSYNAWGYAGNNPILSTDPTGHRPRTDPCTAFASEDVCLELFEKNRRDPTQAPPALSWYPGFMDLDPISGIMDPAEGVGAQLRVSDHQQRWADEHGRPVDRDDPDARSWWGNLCGVLSLAAIFGEDASVMVDLFRANSPGWNPWEGQTSERLARFVNSAYRGTFEADWLDVDQANRTGAWLRQQLASHTYVMPLVEIMSGSGWGSGGTVGVRTLDNGRQTAGGICGGEGNPICHWVVVTGVSSQWAPGNENSPKNWVRIFNPFRNGTEYYRWWGLSTSPGLPDWGFYVAWEHTESDFRAVLVRRTPTRGR